MNSNPVVKRHYPEKAPFQFRDGYPESITIRRLSLHSHGMLDRPNAPFPPDEWSLPHDFLIEVWRESVGRHDAENSVDRVFETSDC